MKKKQLGFLVWVIYLLIILLRCSDDIFPMPKGRDFWRDFSVGLGLSAHHGRHAVYPDSACAFCRHLRHGSYLKVHHYLSVVSV